MEKKRKPLVPANAATRLRILLVEDSALDAEFNLRALEHAGIPASGDIVSTPEDLQARLREQRYDVVLSDYRLRGWTGLQALEMVREQDPATPFLLVTGTLGDELAVDCLKHGASDYVRKDHLDRLPQAVRDSLERAAKGTKAVEFAARLAVEKASLEMTLEGRRSEEDALRDANARLSGWASQLEQRVREMDLLDEMDSLLQLSVNAKQTCGVLAHFAGRLFGEDSGALRLLSTKSKLLETAAVWGPNPPSVRSILADDCLAMRSGKVVDALEQAFSCHHVGTLAPFGSVCVPVVGQNEILGLLELRLATPPEKGSEGIRSVEALRRRALTAAEHFGRTLVSLRLRESLLIESIRDPLTGLFNRRYLEEALDRELHRAVRSRRPLGLVMIDVDHFKKFNDTYGHAAGDAMLRSLGRLLQTRTRQEDIACRYGGEEFLLILPEATLDVTWHRAEQLRAEALKLRVQADKQTLQPVTLSLGVAAYPKHGATPRELLACADSHLYLAKNAGRDRVVAGEPIQHRMSLS